MNVLVATHQTQGARDGDYCATVDGELVRLPGLTCDCPDCGCDRGFAGLSSSRATTTAVVVDHPSLDPAAFTTLLHDALVRDGWMSRSAEDYALAANWAAEHLEVAAALGVGTVVELRDARVQVRALAV